METIEEKSTEIPAKKARKPYTRKPQQQIPPPIATIPVPQAPNPNIVAMQSKIGELVELRMQAEYRISQANEQLVAAQGWVQKEQAEFQRIDSQIQYRMGLINQMQGGAAPAPAPAQYAAPPMYPPAPQMYPQPQSAAYAPAVPFPQYPPSFDPRSVPSFGVGSVPGPNHGLYPDVTGGPEGAITGNAEQLRQEEMKMRQY